MHARAVTTRIFTDEGCGINRSVVSKLEGGQLTGAVLVGIVTAGPHSQRCEVLF